MVLRGSVSEGGTDACKKKLAEGLKVLVAAKMLQYLPASSAAQVAKGR